MHIENHLLYGANGLQVAYRETPNHSGQFAPDNLKYLIMHYTASVTGAPAINWLVNPAAKASAHLVIDRDGTITQLAPFNRITWHAGESAWGNLKFMNQFSIGIELVNAGLLLRKPNGWTTQNNIALPDSDVVLAQHKNGGDIGGWQQYTEAQLAAAQQVATLIVDTYQLLDVLGHDDIAPRRKIDPGPAFPMAGFKGKVMGRNDRASGLYRTTTAVNLRSTPTVDPNNANKINTLPAGTQVDVQRLEGNWSFVAVEQIVDGHNDLEGWVATKYLEKTA